MAKPDFLSAQVAESFQDQSVVEAYQHRPGYPVEAFKFLTQLAGGAHGCVLDVGCGTGVIARNMVDAVHLVDAVDASAAMIARARYLPNGNSKMINWIVGRMEDVPLHRTYDLILAGDSLHWMNWEIVLPRFRSLLRPKCHLAIATVDASPPKWNSELLALIRKYSTIQNYQAYDMIQVLKEMNLFREIGRHRTSQIPFVQSLDEYVESFHGRASFSRQRMQLEAAEEFDEAVRQVVAKHTKSVVEQSISAEIVWGEPAPLT